MATHLDLEEQEQVDALKHFWARYGNLISGVLILILGSLAAWNGYKYWQNSQGLQAAALYDEVERAATAADLPRVERAYADIRDAYPSTTYAAQAALLAAKVEYDKATPEGIAAAKSALAWVIEKSSDPGYQAIARLRLSSVLLEAKDYDAALQQISAIVPKEFEPLVNDRKGDILQLQGKKPEAIAAYTAAYQQLDEQVNYRQLVEVKLAALGVDIKSATTTATTTSTGG